MKKIFKHIFNTLLLASCLSFFSCNNFFQNDVENQEDVKKVKITVNVNLGDNSRKAVPIEYSLYYRLNYKLKATCNSDDSYSTELPFDEYYNEIELIAANWSFELTGYDADTPILRSSENVNIDVTEGTVLNFKMVGLVNGVLEYTFPLKNSSEELSPDENPVLVFEVYRYKGSIQDTINVENKLVLSDENYSNKIVIIPNTNVVYIGDTLIETTVYSYLRNITFSLPEGTYFVVCKKTERSEDDPIVDEETVTEGDLKFFFQELVEIKPGITTGSDYRDINNANQTFTITLNTNGGSYGPEVAHNFIRAYEGIDYTCTKDQFLSFKSTIPEPTKKIGDDYYAFLGWYYDEDLKRPAYNYYADTFNIYDSHDETWVGNIQLYAKWAETPAPEILIYQTCNTKDMASKLPVVSSNWRINVDTDGTITNINPSVNIMVDGQAYYLAESFDSEESEWGYNIYFEDTKKIEVYHSPDWVNDKKLCYDNKSKQFYAFLKYDDSWHVYCCNGNYVDDYDLPELEDLNDIEAIAVYDNSIWLSTEKFIYKLKYSESDYEYTMQIKSPKNIFLENRYADFVSSSDAKVTITDFHFTEDGSSLYATVRVNAKDSYGAKLIAGENAYLYFGDLLLVDQTTGKATSLLPYDITTAKTVNGNKYYGISGIRSTESLAGPTRIYAIKEKELVMADEGIFMWTDKDSEHHLSEINRVVVYDIETQSIKYVCPISNTVNDLEKNYTVDNSGSYPSGFGGEVYCTSSLFN